MNTHQRETASLKELHGSTSLSTTMTGNAWDLVKEDIEAENAAPIPSSKARRKDPYSDEGTVHGFGPSEFAPVIESYNSTQRTHPFMMGNRAPGWFQMSIVELLVAQWTTLFAET